MKRRRIFLLICTLLVVASVGFVALRAKEPAYGGVLLSDWVTGVHPKSDMKFSDEARAEAILRIGSNAVPYLVEWLQHQSTRGEDMLQRFYKRLDNASPFPLPKRTDKDARATGVSEIFQLLGPRADWAVDALARITNGTVPYCRATLALSYLGEKAVQPLSKVIRNSPWEVRVMTISSVGNFGTNATGALPALIECLSDKDWRVAAAAADMLGELHLQPKLVVPALIACLRKSNVGLRAVTKLQ